MLDFLSFDDLRWHQQVDTNTLRDVIRSVLPEPIRRINFEASVGYGKTFIIRYLTESYSKVRKVVWVLSNRSAVVEQLAACAGHLPGVLVMTVQAADRRLAQLAQNPAHLILIDEVHMGGSAAQYGRVMACSPNAVTIGFTGTPTPSTFEIFPHHVKGRSASWLTENGFLSPLKYVCPDPLDLSKVRMRNGDYDPTQAIAALEDGKIYGNVIDDFRGRALGVPSLGFCVNVDHAMDTAKQFRRAGHDCLVCPH